MPNLTVAVKVGDDIRHVDVTILGVGPTPRGGSHCVPVVVGVWVQTQVEDSITAEDLTQALSVAEIEVVADAVAAHLNRAVAAEREVEKATR